MNFWQIVKDIDGKVGVIKMSKKLGKGSFTEDWLPIKAIQNNMII